MDIRVATENDCEMLFHWANDPLIREMAFSQKKIDYADHEKWFLSRLSSNDTCIFIAKVDNNPIGQVRFDNRGRYFEIDVHLAPEQRGKGYASNMLVKSCEALFAEFPAAEVKAVVKLNNPASFKAFRKAHFELESTETIQGEDCYVLSLTMK
ncbi:GNAT family N-acetyltransferase [Thalassotalea fusca]